MKEITGYIKPDLYFLEECLCSSSAKRGKEIKLFAKNPEEYYPMIQSMVYAIATGGGVNFDITDFLNSQCIVQVVSILVQGDKTTFTIRYDEEEYPNLSDDITKALTKEA